MGEKNKTKQKKEGVDTETDQFKSLGVISKFGFTLSESNTQEF